MDRDETMLDMVDAADHRRPFAAALTVPLPPNETDCRRHWHREQPRPQIGLDDRSGRRMTLRPKITGASGAVGAAPRFGCPPRFALCVGVSGTIFGRWR
jgi:hypothetical protein